MDTKNRIAIIEEKRLRVAIFIELSRHFENEIRRGKLSKTRQADKTGCLGA